MIITFVFNCRSNVFLTASWDVNTLAEVIPTWRTSDAAFGNLQPFWCSSKSVCLVGCQNEMWQNKIILENNNNNTELKLFFVKGKRITLLASLINVALRNGGGNKGTVNSLPSKEQSHTTSFIPTGGGRTSPHWVSFPVSWTCSILSELILRISRHTAVESIWSVLEMIDSGELPSTLLCSDIDGSLSVIILSTKSVPSMWIWFWDSSLKDLSNGLVFSQIETSLFWSTLRNFCRAGNRPSSQGSTTISSLVKNKQTTFVGLR